MNRRLAALLFAASRLFLLFAFTPQQSDLWIYEQYAREHAEARAGGRGVYAFHAADFDRRHAEAESAGRGAPAPETRSIEYPPLAVYWMILPTVFLGETEGGALPGYARAYRALSALVDAVGFALLLWLVPRFFPDESPRRHFERWMLYVVSGLLLGHLLYDRLDLLVGVLVLGALALLSAPAVHPVAAFGVLALAVHYKLVPLVAAPALVLGSLSAAVLRARPRALLVAAGGRALLLAALISVAFVPFHLLEGPESLGFLRYHAMRGLHVESVPASALLLLSFFGHEVRPWDEFGAWSVRSSLSPMLVRLSPALVALLMLGMAVAFVAAVRGGRVSKSITPVGTTEGTAVVVAFVVASFGFALATSKVFSPQYLLWLVPLVPLLPVRRRTALWLFAAIAALTTVLFPYRYDDVASWRPVPGTDDFAMHGPTPLGKMLLVARNALLVGLSVVALRAAHALARRPS